VPSSAVKRAVITAAFRAKRLAAVLMGGDLRSWESRRSEPRRPARCSPPG
jgi:hypothetical protein